MKQYYLNIISYQKLKMNKIKLFKIYNNKLMD